MPHYLQLKNFNKGPVTKASHEQYRNAYLMHTESGQKSPLIRYILKRNRDGEVLPSQLEVACSKLMELFLAPHFTSDQQLVVDDKNQIWGLAVRHICYAINDREIKREKDRQKEKGTDTEIEAPLYYKLISPYSDFTKSTPKTYLVDNLPVRFLDELPHGYFKHLLAQQPKLTIDYASLANIFATSYFLEEDDLHKGNFGFYIVHDKETQKPTVRFFKIDHDLTFNDSIMSQVVNRFFHWTHDEQAFAITARDLKNFPVLKDAKTTYWPTNQNFLKYPFHNKHYGVLEEVEAFASLGQNKEFQDAKWLAFYKHVLMPKEVIHASLRECYDETDPYQRSQLHLILQACLERQARLRAVLFSVNDFRVFAEKFTNKQVLINEIAGENNQYKTLVENSMQKYADVFKTIEDKDTPLHIAIKLGEYRYDETLKTFKRYINESNGSGLTPLALAINIASQQKQEPPADIGQDGYCIAKHLFDNGAKSAVGHGSSTIDNQAYENNITPYTDEAKNVKDYPALYKLLTKIGEDHRYCLKSKKNLALDCIKAFIAAPNKPDNWQKIVADLKTQINAHETKACGLSYIRQLRSNLYIIRQIRGLYGYSSTLWDINTTLFKALNDTQATAANPCSFFACKDNISEALSYTQYMYTM